MRLSRDKINHITSILVEDLKDNPDVDFIVDEGEVRANVQRSIINELMLDDEIDEEVRRTLSSYSSRLLEGSREWEILYWKHYEQESNRRGL
ncbi:MAG: hypothetical protein CMH79_04125 [Nitrospinae bacterium]|nr:hypothetical protein [Nitrospinota bacterium]|tara:strand:- start:491 stop:766 length:276 start_codon:yes stop_codon:yes gene_type:complete